MAGSCTKQNTRRDLTPLIRNKSAAKGMGVAEHCYRHPELTVNEVLLCEPKYRTSTSARKDYVFANVGRVALIFEQT